MPMKPLIVSVCASPHRSCFWGELLVAAGCRVAAPGEECEVLLLGSGGDAPALAALSPAVPVIVEAQLEEGARQAGLQPFAVLSPPLFDSLIYSLRRLSMKPATGALASGKADGIIACGEPMLKLRELVHQVAAKSVTVMLTGPSGSGKELIARSIHRLSERSGQAFVPVNCGAIPRELLESELFGHERGAFTGAISSRAGRFEMANGGTLFLDEIGDMALEMQVKILRAIQEKCFERVGSSTSRSADVRIIAATHRDLPAMIAAGEFREDLYYRLNVFPIEVPGLAERREDIPALVADISQQLANDGVGEVELSLAALQSLQRHQWSGNVRELANLLERLAIMHSGQTVTFADLPEPYRHSGEAGWSAPHIMDHQRPAQVPASPAESFPEEGVDLKLEIRELEIRRIRESLERSGGVVTQAAKLLGLQRTTLIEKMRKYEVSA